MTLGYFTIDMTLEAISYHYESRIEKKESTAKKQKHKGLNKLEKITPEFILPLCLNGTFFKVRNSTLDLPYCKKMLKN